MAATANDSPAREPTTRGRGGRGRGRGGRGRGNARGGTSSAALTKTTTAKAGRGGSRRGRAKNFSDSRVQAAYERQRHIKHTYQAVAQSIKPALQELAERSIEKLLQDPDAYKNAQEFRPIVDHLDHQLQHKLAEYDRRLENDLNLAEHLHHADNYVAEQEFKNGLEEIEEQFQESQENRLRILNSLFEKGLPADVKDDQYQYVIITDKHYDDEFGIYECYKDGKLVPYPSRVEGTEMWHKARAYDAAVAAAATAAPVKGRGRGRGVNKRRAQEQPEGQPTPKKNTRSTADDLADTGATIAPAKGLLASALEVDDNPEGTPGELESAQASPEPPSFVNGLAPAIAAKVDGVKLSAREKSPPLPRNMSDPDEYGVCTYSQRPSMREKGINSRLFAPATYQFQPHEIGYRDSTNDSSKGHTRAKRGKYLDTPNSNGAHIDHWCYGHDYSSMTPDDFDQDLVKAYGLHPKYGITLPNPPAYEAPKTPYVQPGKPIVFICHPSGRISHASRSFLKTVNHHRSEDSPWRTKISASLRRFCKMVSIEPEEISTAEYVRPDDELRTMSLGTARRELDARPVIAEEISDDNDDDESEPEDELVAQPEGGFSDLSILSYAGAFLEAQESNRVIKPIPKPARYDAIRDVFTDSKPAPEPEPEASPNNALYLLAELSNVVGGGGSTGAVSVNGGTQFQIYAVAPETAMAPAAMSPDAVAMVEASLIPESVAMQEGPGAHSESSMVNGVNTTPLTTHSLPESDIRGSIPRGGEYAPLVSHQGSMGPRYDSVEVSEPYLHPQHRSRTSMPPAGPVHGHQADLMPYLPVHDHGVPQHQAVRHPEYAPHPASAGPPVQDQGSYVSHGGYPNPPNPDPRDAHMAAGRPIDPGYHPRRMSGYTPEAPRYSQPYWSQQPPGPPPPGPPPPGPPPNSAIPSSSASGPGPSPYHQSPAPPPARIPFSHNGSAEPLPPLRPPRGRNQSLQDENVLDPSLRSSVHSNLGGSYYPPGPPGSARSYHRAYPEPQNQNQLQLINTERILPNPQPAGQGYMTSPRQGYAHQVLSPTYANPPPMSAQMTQDFQESHQGMSSSIHGHRSTPSGSSDAGNKYRKLQPAPVPAHRSWLNKPELKTIPYDHKETGPAAALPNSGPTQIRGWNVNQVRKRAKSDRPEPGQDREDSR